MGHISMTMALRMLEHLQMTGWLDKALKSGAPILN